MAAGQRLRGALKRFGVAAGGGVAEREAFPGSSFSSREGASRLECCRFYFIGAIAEWHSLEWGMTEVEHVEFLNSVIHKHGLNVKVPLVSDPSFPTPIIAYFKSDADGYSLLALSMVAYLIDHCRETT